MRCQRQWGNGSHECEEQQQSCGQAMHGASVVEAYQLAVDESKSEDAHGWRNNCRVVVKNACEPRTSGVAVEILRLRHELRFAELASPLRMTTSLGFALDLGPPPANADEQETPVAEEFRGLAFEGVADELEKPSEEEKTESIRPQAMDEDAG
jgi:hypothetical protein